MPTGLGPLDHLTGGGFPANRVTLISGPPGSGKTILCLHTLLQAARRGEASVFVSFSENPRQLVENASYCGWDLEALEQERLVILDGRPRPGALETCTFDLNGLLGGVRAVSTEISAKRIVFDSIDVILELVNDRSTGLQDLFRLREWLSENNLTAVFTANDWNESAKNSHIHQLQFVADCSLALDLAGSGNPPTRTMRIEKFRGSGFLPSELPFQIGNSGIEFVSSAAVTSVPGPQGGIHAEIELARKQLTQRVQELNQFFEMKQAELDFLLERQPDPTSRGNTPRRRASARSSGKLS